MRRLVIMFVVAAAAVTALTACQPEPNCDQPGGPTFSAARGTGISQMLLDCPPPPPCTGCGEVYGEPHYTTFDGHYYSLQTPAELVLTRSTDRRFEIQVRQEPINNHVSGITMVAVRMTGSRFTVAGEGGRLRIDGEPVDLESGETFRTTGGTLVHQLEELIVLEGPQGHGTVHIVTRRSTMLGVLVDPPDAERGTLEGLLGNANGDTTDDLVLVDGEFLIGETFETLHPALAVAWRVTQETTLFDYEDELGPDDYWDPTIPVRRLGLDDFSDEERAGAEAVCRAEGVIGEPRLERCIFDVLVVGDPALARPAAGQQLAAGIDLDHDSGDEGPELADIIVTWSTLVPNTGIATNTDLVGGVIITQTFGVGRGPSLLIGLAADTGQELWRLEGIDARTTIVLDGEVIVAVAEKGSPLAAPDGNSSLVAIDAMTGELIDARRHDPDPDDGDPPLTHTTELVVVGDVLVVRAGNRVLTYDLADLSFLHQTILGGQSVFELVANGTDGVWVGWNERGSTRIARVDAHDGALQEVMVLDGRVTGPRGVVGSPDGGLVIAVSGDTERLVALDADGEQIWATILDENQRAPKWLTLADGAVAGFVQARLIGAFTVDDGTRRWTAETSSFTNNDDQVIGLDEGSVVLGSFGGAFLEAVGPDDADGWEIASEVPFKEGNAPEIDVLGPIVGDDVVGIGHADGGLLVVAVPTSRGR